MSFALAAVDKAIVVVEAEPSTLFAVVGRVIVLFPVASCVKIIAILVPATALVMLLRVILPVSVYL